MQKYNLLDPPVALAQDEDELFRLLGLYKVKRPRTVLEIGTWEGGTLYYWLLFAQPGTKVITVDLGARHWRPAQPDFDFKQWQDWITPGVELVNIWGDSSSRGVYDQVRTAASQGLDWVFIDGDHSYQGVKADWDTYRPLVNEGGIMAFHDIKAPPHLDHIQVKQLWDEIQAEGYNTEEFKAGLRKWGGIGVVYL